MCNDKRIPGLKWVGKGRGFGLAFLKGCPIVTEVPATDAASFNVPGSCSGRLVYQLMRGFDAGILDTTALRAVFWFRNWKAAALQV